LHLYQLYEQCGSKGEKVGTPVPSLAFFGGAKTPPETQMHSEKIPGERAQIQQALEQENP